MIKTGCLWVMTFLFAIANAQEFSAYITFYRTGMYPIDTITIGYDANATDTLDAQFGEVNIYSTPRDTGIDVRIGNIWNRQNIQEFSLQSPFQTKKQIVPNRCGTNTASIIELNIVSNKWPVGVNWTKKEFLDSCRNGTSLTNMHPLHWWNGIGFREVLSVWDWHPIYPNQWFYVDGADTVYTYWIGVGDSESVTYLIRDLNPDVTQMRLFPNPANTLFKVELPSDFKLRLLEVYSLEGTKVLEHFSEQVEVSHLLKGVYTVVLHSEDKRRVTTKLVKL